MKEEVSKVLTTVLTTRLMMPAAVVAVGAVAAAAPPLEVHRLSAPFLFAEIKHKSLNSVITTLLKMYTIPEINTSS